MVRPRVFGFLLLFLLRPASGIDSGKLKDIINQLHNKYGLGHSMQYAMGINVPVKYCEEMGLDNNFLQTDSAQEARNAMNGNDRVYNGVQLIGARPKPIPNTNVNYHSEYLLLVKSMSNTLSRFDPLMQNLLNSNPAGCAIFLTLNSPCVKTCSTPNGPYSILPALDMFRNRHLKAFVFRQVWTHDVIDGQWENNLKEINTKIPVYRCNANTCTRCVNGNKVDKTCLTNNSHG